MRESKAEIRDESKIFHRVVFNEFLNILQRASKESWHASFILLIGLPILMVDHEHLCGTVNS